MKKYLILLFVALFASPAIAERPRLRGPSNPKSRHIIGTNTRYHHNNYSSNRYKRYRRYRGSHRIYRSPNRVVIIIQNRPRSISSYPTIKRVITKQGHKTIYVGSRSHRSPLGR